MGKLNSGKLKVLLIDPSYDDNGISSPTIPLGIGMVGTCLLQKLPNAEIKILKLASNIIKHIREKRPDIIGIGNYMWNTQLCVRISKIARKINPDTLIIFGGPEINRTHMNRDRFVKLYSSADFLIETEGEIAFTNIIQAYLQAGRDRVKLREYIDALGNCFFIRDGNFISGPRLPKIKDLNQIPSPYISGLLDEFLNNKHFQPLLETNRGCPFSCTYCQQGNSYYNKVAFKTPDFVINELNYIAKRVDVDAGLYLIDANWGMYKQDIQIAEHLKHLHATINWPKYVDCDTGKSNYKQIRKIAIDILPGLMSVSNSVQSMNPLVLENIKRPKIVNIENILRDFSRETQQPDFILPLPGETKESFISGLKKMLDTGVNVRFRVHPTQILCGTEMDNSEAIEKYGLCYKYRQHSNFMGNCDGEYTYEIERVVLATKDMSIDDVFYCRIYTVILDTLIRRAPFRELFLFLKSVGLMLSDVTRKLIDDIQKAPAGIISCMEEYRESYLESMFDTEEEVINYMEKYREDYILGNKGGDLLKYSQKLWIDHYVDFMTWFFGTISEMVVQMKNPPLEEIKNLERYTRFLYCDREQQDSHLSEKIEAEFDYDIVEWFGSREKKTIREFQRPTKYVFWRTEYSVLSRENIWNSFGFYKSKSYQPPIGTDSRYYLYKLRRRVKKTSQ